MPLPEPLGELRASKSAPLGQDRALIPGVPRRDAPVDSPSPVFDVEEDTELQGFSVTSSLHLARLATALSACMQDPDAVHIRADAS